jgi:4-aminobutyrate aminotransferase-like enzyme
VLLCADEVIGGFGRTGEWFAHRHFGFDPDLICITKGLTSSYVPMGGLVMCRLIGAGGFRTPICIRRYVLSPEHRQLLSSGQR